MRGGVPEINVYTDFAAQQECHGQDRATCGTSAHVNKCIFVVLSNPRAVKVEVNGTLVDKRIHDCDTWTFFLPASGKHKENDFVAHHTCLRNVVEYYQSKLHKERNTTVERVWLFADGCRACRRGDLARSRNARKIGRSQSKGAILHCAVTRSRKKTKPA